MWHVCVHVLLQNLVANMPAMRLTCKCQQLRLQDTRFDYSEIPFTECVVWCKLNMEIANSPGSLNASKDS